jgi:predicted NBD/HSP70 family sugar kinase
MMPGLINSQEGRNYTHLDFGSKTITEVLEEKFKRPVFIENDAKAMAYSELRFGKAREKKNVLVIFHGVGTWSRNNHEWENIPRLPWLCRRTKPYSCC